MHIVVSVILLISLVLFSNVISHFIPSIPVSLIQIGLGLVLALFSRFSIPLNTDWFLLLFIAPLLFNDGRRFPKRELWKLKGPILANAVILVFLTTILGGLLFHLVIPTMPFSVSFALAAILSPTDPVAVQSIAKKTKLPEDVMHIVNGESLINDASGLIAFKYAIAATVTGVFSIKAATLDFFYISIVGFLVGLLLMAIILFIQNWLYQQGINDLIFNTVLQITTPFVIYLITEDFLHASGLIAVVTGGIFAHLYGSVPEQGRPELTLVSEKTWDIIIYILNGIVFVILGSELPFATNHVISDNNINTLLAFGISVICWLILFVIRVLWIFGYQISRAIRGNLEDKKFPFRNSLLAGLSGVRGAITMAGVLSIPLTINGGRAFPSRSLALFIAAIVIIISLVVATITLPLVSEDKTPLLTRASNGSDVEETAGKRTASYVSEDQARIYIMKLAVQNIEENRRPDNTKEAYDLILDYQFMIRQLEIKNQSDSKTNSVIDDEVALRRVALNGEMKSLRQLFSKKEISKSAYLIAYKRLDKVEKRLMKVASGKARVNNVQFQKIVRIKNLILMIFNRRTYKKITDDLSLIQREGFKQAISELSKYFDRKDIVGSRFNSQSIYHLVVHYRNQIEIAKAHSKKISKAHNNNMQNLRIKALAAQREGVQILLEQGEIDWAMAARLRQYINYSEAVLIMDYQNEE